MATTDNEQSQRHERVVERTETDTERNDIEFEQLESVRGDVPGAGGRRRRGRPRGSTKAAIAASATLSQEPKPARGRRPRTPVFAPEAFVPLYGLIFSMLAKRRGPHWAISPDEAHAMADATAGLVRHLPIPVEQLGLAADILAFGAVSVAIVMPRVAVDQQMHQRVSTAATAPVSTNSSHTDVPSAFYQPGLGDSVVADNGTFIDSYPHTSG